MYFVERIRQAGAWVIMGAGSVCCVHVHGQFVGDRFACDAMLGALARWLRAAGYDASWQYGIPDHDLIQRSQDEGRTLLSSDSGIFHFALIRDGVQPALFVPRGLRPLEQLRFVLDKLGLSLRQPVAWPAVESWSKCPRSRWRAACRARTFAWLERFWECSQCRKVFWDPLETDRRGVAVDDCHERRGRPDRATSADRPGGAALWQNDELTARLPTKTPPPSIRAPILQ